MTFIMLYFIVAAIYIWTILTSGYHHLTHMLQLNSYYNVRYFGYLKKNPRELLDYKAVLSLAAYVFMFFGVFPAASAYALIYLLLDMVKPKKKEKKPLVVTKRVVCLFW